MLGQIDNVREPRMFYTVKQMSLSVGCNCKHYYLFPAVLLRVILFYCSTQIIPFEKSLIQQQLPTATLVANCSSHHVKKEEKKKEKHPLDPYAQLGMQSWRRVVSLNHLYSI